MGRIFELVRKRNCGGVEVRRLYRLSHIRTFSERIIAPELRSFMT